MIINLENGKAIDESIIETIDSVNMVLVNKLLNDCEFSDVDMQLSVGKHRNPMN